jgi:hypothetical protein
MPNTKIPRQAIYQSFKDSPGACPRCGADMIQEYQAYAVTTREGKKIADSFIVSGDFGWFCNSCPTIVINKEEVGEMLSFQKSGWKAGSEFLVLGIVDLDAIPASKRHLPIGDPDNPLPLVRFSETPQHAKPSKSPKRSKRKRHR